MASTAREQHGGNLNHLENGLPLEEKQQITTLPEAYEVFAREERMILRVIGKLQPKPIANPAPLGLCGFALTTFVLSLFNAGGLVSIHTPHGVVYGLALFYGGLVQLLAGMWEFKNANAFGAVAFSSYGGFWMSLAAINIKAFGFLDSYKTRPNGEKELSDCLGIYLLSWSMFSLWMTIASHRTTVCLFTLFFLVFLTFLMLSISEFTGEILCREAGGCFGVMAAILAWYCAFAALLTKDNSLFLLPVGQLDPIYKKWGWLPAEAEEKATH